MQRIRIVQEGDKPAAVYISDGDKTIKLEVSAFSVTPAPGVNTQEKAISFVVSQWCPIEIEVTR